MKINLRISGLPVIAFTTLYWQKEMEYTKHPEKHNAFFLRRTAEMYPIYFALARES